MIFYLRNKNLILFILLNLFSYLVNSYSLDKININMSEKSYFISTNNIFFILFMTLIVVTIVFVLFSIYLFFENRKLRNIVINCNRVKDDFNENEDILYSRLKQLGTVLTGFPVILWAIDKKGKFLLSEGNGLLSSGLKPGEVVGRSIFDMYKDNNVIQNNIWKGLNGEIHRYESKANGNSYETIITPEFDTNRNVIRVYGLSIDITDRVNMEDQLKKAKAEAESASNAKNDFLANMSHEIRTPMNVILGFAEILKDKLKNFPEYESYIKSINVAGENLLHIIDDILDLSKIEAGRLEIKKEFINFNYILYEIQKLFSLKASKKDVLINVVIDDRMPEVVFLDETRLRQILFNIVGNAVKFTHSGSVNINIHYEKITQSICNIVIEVKDTGVGIPSNQLNTIFEPFRQQEGQKDKIYNGTGLGLTISRRLIEMMNGTIEVESELHKGTIFRIKFPNVEVRYIKEKSKNNNDDANRNVVFKEAKMLIVDDVKANRDLVKAYLQGYDIKIVEAENGSEAIEVSINELPDLILMDLQMFGMNGYDAINILKSKQLTKNIPIVALTAFAMKSEEDDILKNCEGYLKKPFLKSALIDVLMKFLMYDVENNKNKIVDKVTVFKDSDILSRIQHQLVEVESKRPLYILIDKLDPVFHDIEGSFSLDETEEFAEILIDFGDNNDMPSFTVYGKEIKEAVRIMNFERIEKLVLLYEYVRRLIDNR